MNKIWLVLKTEFINTITRRSFLLTLILIPLVPALILGGIALFGGRDALGDAGDSEQPTEAEKVIEGYVDQAGIIKELPEWAQDGQLVAFADDATAHSAALAGEITAYYIIEPDYLETGAIRYVREDFSILTGLESTGIMDEILRYNLLGADPQHYQIYQNPVMVESVDLEPDVEERDQSSPLAFYLPYGVTMLFYILIMTSSSMMLNSIAKEKENRVMEILMSSIKPKQLLAGKILGLGLVGLLQLVVWLGSALIMLNLGGTTLNIPPSLQLPPEIFFWGIPFFILGYLIYATIMAGVGALVHNVKEGSQATFYIMLPILLPLLMVGVIIERPNALLPVILSLIPFTAPNTIMTRMAVSPVPLWQLLVAIGLMTIMVILLIRGVARMFRAQLLLTGKKFSPGLYLKALFGAEIGINE